MTEQQPYGQQPPQHPETGYQVPQYAQHPQYPQASTDWQLQQPASWLPTAPDGRPLADQGRRLVARMLDGLISVVGFYLVGIVIVLILRLVAAVIGVTDTAEPVAALGGVLVLVLLLGGVYAYEVEIPLRWNGQTPGKRIMKIAIASLDPARPLSRGRLAYRMLIAQLFNLLSNCLVGFIDWLWCLWDKPYRQCLHDKGPQTVVVRVGPT